MTNQAYQVTQEDVENVLASNPWVTPKGPNETLESVAAELLSQLDFGAIEDAALFGDSLDEQTDYANDEITKQLRDMGILTESPT